LLQQAAGVGSGKRGALLEQRCFSAEGKRGVEYTLTTSAFDLGTTREHLLLIHRLEQHCERREQVSVEDDLIHLQKKRLNYAYEN